MYCAGRMIFLALSLLHGALLTSGATVDTEAMSGLIEPKIVGGSAIDISQVPYQVSIRLTANDRRSYGSGHMCGGVVISQRLVATAAHCCYISSTYKYRTAGEFFLVMGSSYLKSKDANTLEYYVQQLIVHPSYDHDNLVNDIALMFINGYIPWLWPTVRAVPLNSNALAVNTNCAISGWGLLYDGGSSTNVLQAATVPIILRSTCMRSYPGMPDSQVCAGYSAGGVDACQGDSGGPLVCGGVLGGLVSYGSGCAQAGYPGVYTNVSFYNGWVQQQNSSLNYSIYKNAGSGPGSAGIWWLPLLLAFVLATGSSLAAGQ
ncbi:hypothetical protein KR009_000569 [Drosophila setifemur]|nr:hypothetical protein KR009_000569 [Drosophila setifemur]